MRVLIFLFLTLLLSACVSPPPVGDVFSKVQNDNEDLTTVYLYRPERNGSVVWPRVYINGERIIELPINSYSYILLPPGEYQLRSPQVDYRSGEESTDPRYIHEAEFQITDEKELYLKFHFQETGPSQELVLVGSTPIFYNDPQGHFGWTVLESQAVPEDIKHCKIVLVSNAE